jgi:hypothetical protein
MLIVEKEKGRDVGTASDNLKRHMACGREENS